MEGQLMVVKSAMAGLVAISLMTACTDAPECGVADALVELGQARVGGSDYYIYSRTVGVTDKTRLFELYAQKPTFDTCGQTDQKVLSDAYIDPARGTPVRVIVRGTEMEVEYASGDGAQGSPALEIVVQ
ncbi:hypothetical protein [Nitrogeniibacter aestuarii]|uniref:hypothetical protein n=1 Tax=Nitrogeniibacter aestuarii TaxID=2815343 RepID=UPI001E384C07|nr:hypothetical protein [Nitrogeniibacter aestuarii]